MSKQQSEMKDVENGESVGKKAKHVPAARPGEKTCFQSRYSANASFHAVKAVLSAGQQIFAANQ